MGSVSTVKKGHRKTPSYLMGTTSSMKKDVNEKLSTKKKSPIIKKKTYKSPNQYI